jgi:hypothetical protein
MADKLQAMAEALAASVPEHLGMPTIPPISWAQNGDIVTVILADGRKVSASIQEINQIMFNQMQGLEGNTLYKSLHPDLDNLEVDLRPVAPAKSTASARKRKVRK